ncbi:uncharacterized protein LOC132259326 isoform X1 [Phlebotomus argentipes]|uniref:uncharacterized protein LOC132259326 isoform X1 n=2 Tax=Phlebotomus argentipes TaxID=94469 RepID=UPI0028934D56|nr:uncharacterized protein LOC132259326 isoform X1 [Phlebotomus argentipes]
MESNTTTVGGGRRGKFQHPQLHQAPTTMHHHEHHHQKQHHRYPKDDIAIKYPGGRYSNLCSPTHPPFPLFPPPPDCPPPPHNGTSPTGAAKAPRKNHCYPDDPDSIELCLEEPPAPTKAYKGGALNGIAGSSAAAVSSEPQIKWSRNNIAATMERYEPSTSSYGPALHNHSMYHQDYSYAYYEPGAAMRHSNVPVPGIPGTSTQIAAGPSRPPPPNSIRALLSKSCRNSANSTTPGDRHTYTTRYGTQENIYEEIGGDGRIRILSSGQSMISLNQSMVEEELRRVQNRHRRVLGELNLSVEAMIMPSASPTDSPTEEEPPREPENLAELLNSVGPTDELLSPVSSQAIGGGGDLDSGFSGSSSGASYVGSLRYHRTNSAMSTFPTRSSTPSAGGGGSIYGGSCRSSQRSHEDPGISSFSTRSCSSYSSAKTHQRPAEDPGPSSNCSETPKPSKSSFWSRKGWRKFPGFSSTTSVNKAGATNDEPNLNSGSWEDTLPLSVANKAAMATARHSGSVASPPGATLAPAHDQRNLSHTPSARTVSSEESWCSEGAGSERCLSSDDEDESDRSATSSVTPRNSQLRSTFNKARHHLSFDKWRSSSSASMPTAPQPESTTPGESPGGRLSRWFSIRRGSSHQYDISGKDSGGDSTDNSAQQTPTQSSASRTPSTTGKMPQLSESEEDSPFGLSNLMGSRSNGSLLSLTTRSGIVGRQLPPTLPPAPAGLSQEQLKRRLIVASICHSENSYIGTLQRLVNDYKKPLDESSPPILSSSKISTLFYRLPEILQCHTLFRIAMAECVRNWDRDEKIGDVFIAAFSKPIVLDIYSGFINNFSAAMELAKMEAKRKSALADFFKVKQISAHDRLSFFGLMVKPVQRFPQFILFLQDLLKYTPQGHQDRMALQLALTQLESLAEMLNERKREAEQYQAFKEMLGHISGTFNTRSLSTDGNSRNRCLLREDNVTQLEFNQCGFIVKSKQRRLLLLNDKVICVSVAPKQSSDFGATEKLSFKWMFPVADVEIVDNSTSATLSRILTAGLNRGGSLKSNASQSSGPDGSAATNGADNLCNEMSNLMHDYEIVSRINDLVGSLKGSYSEISTDITRKIMQNIQGSIQKKDEEMAWMDSCCLQLVAKSKSGKEETFTFQTENPSVKKEWITELRLAQLALDPNNSPSWEVPDHERRPLTKMPLFVKAQSINKTQHQTEVRCGCYYSITSSRLTARRKTRVQNYLWICTTDGTSSRIAILVQHPQQTGLLKDVSAFDLPDTVATAMEFVRGTLGAGEMDASCDGIVDGDSVWIGTDNKKILVYAACNPEQEEQVATCPVPGNVSQILHHSDYVAVSLSSGCVLIFRKRPGGSWNLAEPQVVSLASSEPVTSVLPINASIYAACGKKVWVLSSDSGEITKTFEVKNSQHPGSLSVNLMAHSGIGLWISLKHSSIICLYHTESFKHLQDLNIASNVLKLTSSQKESPSSSSSVFVTALMATKGLLWVGTNVGIALTIPLPRLEGVPIISGGVSISYHAHFGPITFLLPLIPKMTPPAPKGSALKGTPGKGGSSKGQENESGSRESPSNNSDHQPVMLARRKIEKQLSTESPVSVIPAKLKAHLTNSPVVLRRQRFKEASESMRMSQTLPRGLGSGGFFSQSSHSNVSSLHGSEHGCCDVYGLYGGLIFVKEDYEAEEGQGNLMDPSYECLRRSDPELIPIKVSTLDRRMRMKVSRPRSLDLSNWSVDSRSSSMYTSSGSEESMGVRLQSVSRNSSNASRKINATETPIPVENHDHHEIHQPTHTIVAPVEAQTNNQIHPAIPATMQRPKKNGKQTQQLPEIAGKRTIITLTGGRGYINWRHVWYNTSEKQQRSGSINSIPRVPNSSDAHIVVWEKKL